MNELIVCSLERCDDVWRRNQFLTSVLLERHPALRVLFVEPPADPLFELAKRRRPQSGSLRAISADGRLKALRPVKPLPRRFGGLSDSLLRLQVARAARRLGFAQPLLWINDVTYAPLIGERGWRAIYDVTDDWLLAPFAERELERLRALDEVAMREAREVVVCSPALAESRGSIRTVTLVPNGVDVAHFRRPRSRPVDLPAAPVAVYVGTLHDARLDVDLTLELAGALSSVTIALVGPDALSETSRRRLAGAPNIRLLGARTYDDVPAYLQHADVVVVPHTVSPFTESLDPIKAYEALAVGTSTVATPVAGFRSLGGCVTVADRVAFVAAVAGALGAPAGVVGPPPSSWEERADAFERALLRAVGK